MRRQLHCQRPLCFQRKRCGAALYTLVVFNAFLLGVLGLSALTVSRIERRQNQSGIHALHAKRLATSGIRLAKLQIDQDQNWRTTVEHGVFTSPYSIGEGTIRIAVKDSIDSDLSNNPADQIVIISVGEFGDATWSEQVEAEPIQGPPEFLKMCLHVGETMLVSSTCRLNLLNGPISANKDFQLNGQLWGDIECRTLSGNGYHVGNSETNKAPKALPKSSVFADYQAKATALAYTGAMTGVVITPTANTYGGGTNTEGLYYIHPGGNALILDGVRLEGTLVVDGDVSINNAAFLKNVSQKYPALIVRGNLSIELESKTRTLKESDYNTNFNPIGAEYLGSSDADESDSYPNQIEGLIHVMGELETANSPFVDGCVVCEGGAVLNGSLEIHLDTTLYSYPPWGYEELPGPRMKFRYGTWERISAQ